MAKLKKENMDPIVDTPVIAPSTDPEATVIGDSVAEDAATAALRTRLEAEIRAKIAAENATKVDPGFIKPGVRTAYQEAISQTTVQQGGIPLDAQASKPLKEYEVSAGTIRQDY